MEITNEMRVAGAIVLRDYVAPGVDWTKALGAVIFAMSAVAPKHDAATITSDMAHAGTAALRAHNLYPNLPTRVVESVYHAMRKVAPSLAAAQSTAMLRADLADAPERVKRHHDLAHVSELIQDDGGDTERRAEAAHQADVPAVELRVLRALFAARVLTTEQYQLSIQALGGIKHVG